MSLKRQTVWSILPLLSVTVVNIISVPLFYRYLGSEMYALWFYVITFIGMFGFMDLGIGVAVGRYMGIALGRGDMKAVREYWGTGNAIVLPLLALMAIIFTGLGVWFGPLWFNVASANVSLLRGSFVAGGIGLFLSYYCQYWLILSQAHLDFKFLGILRTAVSLLQVIPSIPLAWATGNPLVLIGWGILISFLQLAIFIWHANKRYGLRLNLGDAAWIRAREMATYTGKTFVSVIVNSVAGSVDRLVLGRLAPAADFTRYAICTNVGGRIQGLSVAVMGPVFNQTNRAVGSGDRASAASVYNQTFDFTFPWYLLVSVWVAIWHPVLLRLWLGSELGSSVSPLFVPVIVASCLTAVASISSAQLGSLNRVGVGLIFNLATVCLLVLGTYFGWYWSGVAGVAWAFLVSRAPVVAQDLFVIVLVKAGGWLAMNTWKHVVSQVALGLAFSTTMLLWPRESFWQLIPAALHGLIVTAWLLRKTVRKGSLKINDDFAPRPA
jgi:O-antigen/teichoic acid export membrane protein